MAQGRKKSKLICFTGIDGAGKTALAKLIADELRKGEVNCCYVYGRYQPILSKPMVALAQHLFLKDMDIREYQKYAANKRRAINKHPSLVSLYRRILLIDYSLQLLFKLLLPKMFNRTIICDRYVFDTVINDIPREDNKFSGIKSLLGTCFSIAPKPDLLFVIDVPEKIAFSRKDDTPSVEYLKERRGIYLRIAKEYGAILLDGTKSLEELKTQIKEKVLEWIKL